MHDCNEQYRLEPHQPQIVFALCDESTCDESTGDVTLLSN